MVSYEFTDKTGEIELHPAIEAVVQTSPALAADLPPFLKMAGLIQSNEVAHLAQQVPDDYEFSTNIDLDVLDWSFVLHKALISFGHESVIVGRQGDRDGRIVIQDSDVAVYAKPTGLDAISKIGSGNDAPFLHLLADASYMPIPPTFILDSTHSHSWINDPKLASLPRPELIPRMYMTAMLHGIWDLQRDALKGTTRLDSYLHLGLYNYHQESAALYQTLSEQGIRPLGFEEVYGLVTSEIATFMNSNPALDFRQQKPSPTSALDYF